MNRIFCLALALLITLCLAACGGSGDAPQSSNNEPQSAPTQTQEQQPAKPEPTVEPEPPQALGDLVVIDGNTITVKDDGNGTADNGNGIEQTPVLTNRDIGYHGEAGSIIYDINGIQVSKLIANTDDTASLLGVDKGQEITLVAIEMSVENTSDENISFYPYMSTIITNTKEQVDSDWLLSDSVGGEFLGNVEMSGQIYWICKSTNADDLSHIQWRIDAPHNSDFDRISDDIKIEIELAK